MKLYVGNLSYDVTEEILKSTFEEYGQVTSSDIIRDRQTGRSKGFGFVEMPEKAEGEKAIEELDGVALLGRNVKVNEARPREERPQGRPRRY